MEAVTIIDVAPRDGLQNEPEVLEVATRVELIERLLAAGVPRVEIGSFVNPRQVPQMAGAGEIARLLAERGHNLAARASNDTFRFTALAPNQRGYELAAAAGCATSAWCWPPAMASIRPISSAPPPTRWPSSATSPCASTTMVLPSGLRSARRSAAPSMAMSRPRGCSRLLSMPPIWGRTRSSLPIPPVWQCQHRWLRCARWPCADYRTSHSRSISTIRAIPATPTPSPLGKPVFVRSMQPWAGSAVAPSPPRRRQYRQRGSGSHVQRHRRTNRNRPASLAGGIRLAERNAGPAFAGADRQGWAGLRAGSDPGKLPVMKGSGS